MLWVLVVVTGSMPDGYSLQDGTLTVSFGSPQDITAADIKAVLAEGGNFTQLRLGVNVLSVAEEAFYKSPVRQVLSPEATVASLGIRAFAYSASLETVRLPSSLKLIDGYAFAGCSSLRTLDIEQTSVERLGGMVLFSCGALISLRLPPTLRIIDSYAFDTADGLVQLELPASVESVGWSAFYACRALAELRLDHTQAREIGDWAFGQCLLLRTITFPETVLSLGSSAFRDCRVLTSVDLPDSIESIGIAAFVNCLQLSRIHLPARLHMVRASAFGGCARLSQVTWPVGLTVVGDGAFSSTSIQRVELVGTVNVSIFAFDQCKYMTSVRFGPSLQNVLDRAFFQCTSLTEIALPASLRQLGMEAFAECSKVYTLSLYGDITSFGMGAFRGLDSVQVVNIRSPPIVVGTYCQALQELVELAVIVNVTGQMEDFCGVPVAQPARKKSNGGKIAGGIIGGLAAAAVLAGAIYLLVRNAEGKGGLKEPADHYDTIGDAVA